MWCGRNESGWQTIEGATGKWAGACEYHQNQLLIGSATILASPILFLGIVKFFASIRKKNQTTSVMLYLRILVSILLGKSIFGHFWSMFLASFLTPSDELVAHFNFA
jgi:hypothetical protein